MLFIKCTNKQQIEILLLCITYSTLTLRHDHNPVLSVSFWSVFYLLGIYIAQHYQIIKEKIEQNISLLVIFFIIYTTTMLALNIEYRYLLHDGVWTFTIRPNLNTFAKVLLCPIWLFACIKLQKNKGKFIQLTTVFLNFCAKYSFSIYFLHILLFYILWLCKDIFAGWILKASGIELHLFIYGGAVIICIICGGIAAAFKKIIGKNSRMFIGS